MEPGHRRKRERYRKPEGRANDAVMEQLPREHQRKGENSASGSRSCCHLKGPGEGTTATVLFSPDDPLSF